VPRCVSRLRKTRAHRGIFPVVLTIFIMAFVDTMGTLIRPQPMPFRSLRNERSVSPPMSGSRLEALSPSLAS
jgi:hypothetical protein